jgi:hypothetical protein
MTTISQHVLLCPECGLPPTQTQTRYGLRSECCGLWSWDSKPLVDAETHEARKAAHAAFDGLWKGGHMKRTDAYRWLSKALGIPGKECHIAMMDAVTARRVVEVVRQTHPTPGAEEAK